MVVVKLSWGVSLPATEFAAELRALDDARPLGAAKLCCEGLGEGLGEVEGRGLSIMIMSMYYGTVLE